MAASTVYTVAADVTPLLPKNYDTTTDLTSAMLTAIMLAESRYIDSRLGVSYITFNNTTDTVVCPVQIQYIAKLRSGWRAIRHLNVGDRNASLTSVGMNYKEEADELLRELIEGQTNIPAELKTGAVLTAGTGGDYDVEDDEAFIGVEALVTAADIPTLIPESIKVTAPSGLTGYQYSVDFTARFDRGFQKWVFTDLSDAFLGETTPTISYEWTWERYSRDRTPGTVKSGIFVGG